MEVIRNEQIIIAFSLWTIKCSRENFGVLFGNQKLCEIGVVLGEEKKKFLCLF